MPSDQQPSDGAWTIEQLLDAEEHGEHLEFLPFWGHTPPRDGRVGPHVFSQWFVSDFEHGGVRYPTAEHFMMAEKARLFGDDEQLEAILAAPSPREAKALGRGVRGFSADVWEAECEDIVRRVSVAKFASTEPLRSYLVGTQRRVLVEASPTDSIWGVGMDRNDPAIERPSQWKGQNLLGFALMQARADLASGAS